MAKRNKPAGQINNNTAVLKNLERWVKALNKNISIKVGIIGEEGHKIAPGTNLTMADLGAVHEFGAHINHPGGTPYLIKEDGMAQFVPKDKGAKLPKTKPHTIKIPARSFLRQPILGDGKQALLKAVRQQLGTKNDTVQADDLSPETAINLINDTAQIIAQTALLKVQRAFYDDKIKPPTKPTSKKQRNYNPEAPTLIDHGDLLRSITYEIKEIK